MVHFISFSSECTHQLIHKVLIAGGWSCLHSAGWFYKRFYSQSCHKSKVLLLFIIESMQCWRHAGVCGRVACTLMPKLMPLSTVYVKTWRSHCTWAIPLGQIAFKDFFSLLHLLRRLLSPFHTSISTRDFPGRSMYLCAKHLFCAQAVKIMFGGCIMYRACSQQIQQTHLGSIRLVEHCYTAQLQNPWASQRTPRPWPKQRCNASERPRHMVEPLYS